LSESQTRLVVVGDIHGQLKDLIHIIRTNGDPSSNLHYLFNGDFVDRGPRSVEVVLSLYLLLVVQPNSIHLNRGNHEHWRINSKYGFERESLEKYDMEWYKIVQETFRFLPLAHVINYQVLVLHGGLWKEDIDLDRIRKIDRSIDLPRRKDISTDDESLMNQILWSDPRDIEEKYAPSKRGSGIYFGEKLTREFFEKSKLKLLVRSHEVVNKGCSKRHDNLVVTLFSASHYTGSKTNRGAYLVFSGWANEDIDEEGDHAKDVSFSTFTYVSEGTAMAHPLLEYARESVRAKQIGGAEDAVNIEMQRIEALQLLRSRIFEKRHGLMDWYSRADTDKDSTVPVATWARGLRMVIGLHDLPWEKLVGYLACVEKDGQVRYGAFLNRYRLNVPQSFVDAWTAKITTKISKVVLSSADSLEKAFVKMDTNKDGKISYQELVEALMPFDIGLTDRQTYDVMASIDKDGSGYIDQDEFFDAFRLSFETSKAEAPEEFTCELGVQRIQDLVREKKVRLVELFGGDKKARMNRKGIAGAIKGLDTSGSFTREQRYELTDHILHGKKSISWASFKKYFNPKYTSPEWQAELIQAVVAVLFSSRVHLRRLFAILDTDGSGALDVKEFRKGMSMLNECLSNPLSTLQLTRLHHAFDKDGDGVIRYDEFFDTLRIVDSENPDM